MVDFERLERQLVQSVRGRVAFDAPTRARYSSDASGLHAVPIGVVVAATDEDVRVALSIAHASGCPVRARGHGLGWAGQCLGQALIIDATRVADARLEVDVDRGLVTVHGGLAWARVADALRRHGRECPVDALTPADCGDDAANVGVAVAGPTVAGLVASGLLDTVAVPMGPDRDDGMGGAVRVIDGWLADGTVQRFDPFGTHDGRALGDEAERQRISTLFSLLARHHGDIARHWPQVDGVVGGHGWDRLAQVAVKGRTAPVPADVNLASLLCGAQGRMAWMRHVTLKLAAARPFSRLLRVECDAMPPLLGLLACVADDGAYREVNRPVDRPVRTSMHWAAGPDTRHALWIDVRASNGESDLDATQALWCEAIAKVMRRDRTARLRMRVESGVAQRADAWRRHARWMRALRGPGWAGCVEVAVAPARAVEHWRDVEARLLPRLAADGLQAVVCGAALAGAWTLAVRNPEGRQPALERAIDFARRAADLTWGCHGSAIGPHGGGLARGLDAASRRALEAAQFGAALSHGFETMRRSFDGAAQFDASSDLRGSLDEAVQLSISRTLRRA